MGIVNGAARYSQQSPQLLGSPNLPPGYRGVPAPAPGRFVTLYERMICVMTMTAMKLAEWSILSARRPTASRLWKHIALTGIRAAHAIVVVVGKLPASARRVRGS